MRVVSNSSIFSSPVMRPPDMTTMRSASARTSSSSTDTIEAIHTQLLRLRDEGVAILLVSVELEEVRALADRIVVMSGGRITGELPIQEFDTTRIGLLMGGMHKS